MEENWLDAVDKLIKENEASDPDFYKLSDRDLSPYQYSSAPSERYMEALEPPRLRPPKRKSARLEAFFRKPEPDKEEIKKLRVAISLLLATDFYYMYELKRWKVPIPWDELDETTRSKFIEAVRNYRNGSALLIEPDYVRAEAMYDVIGEEEL